MKYLLVVFFVFIAIGTFAQYDTILENSYIKMLDKRYQDLMPIEGIWMLEKNKTITKGKEIVSNQKTQTRVAIYSAGKIYVVTHLSKEFHATEQLTMLHDDEFLFERPADQISASAILQGVQLRINLVSDLGGRQIEKEDLIFYKEVIDV